jgi:hypothetical protein
MLSRKPSAERMSDIMDRISRSIISFACLSALLVAEAGCGRITVDTIRLTLDKWPPKQSTDMVERLGEAPLRPYREVADLAARGESASVKRIRHKMVERAAELGADAVIFHRPQHLAKEGVMYQPVYSPWGYNDPYYGEDPFGWDDPRYGRLGYGDPYGNYRAVPYEIPIISLKGIAIIYTGPASGTP